MVRSITPSHVSLVSYQIVSETLSSVSHFWDVIYSTVYLQGIIRWFMPLSEFRMKYGHGALHTSVGMSVGQSLLQNKLRKILPERFQM